MRVNRGLVFWGVALVTAGAVALAIQSNLIAGETAREAWRLWPVVLIVIGVAVISARTPFAMVATLAAGLVVENIAPPEGDELKVAIERSALPVLIVFFAAAGASLQLDVLAVLGRR